jgi:hypothetical protein
VTRCLTCLGESEDVDDPRLPRLRLPLCRHCRDLVALICGWIPGQWPRTHGQSHALTQPRKWHRDHESIELEASLI